MFENVPGITKGLNGIAFEKFEKSLKRRGYITASGCIEAKNFGVPQKRPKHILIAIRKKYLKNGRKFFLPLKDNLKSNVDVKDILVPNGKLKYPH